MTIAPPPPPASTSSQFASLVCVFLFCGVFFTVWPSEWPPVMQVLLALSLFGLPLMLYDVVWLRTHRRATTGLCWTHHRPVIWPRVARKWLGLAVILAAIAFAYWLFPVYRGGLYRPYLHLFTQALPLILLLAVPYFAYMDRLLEQPEDGYFQLGAWLLGHRPSPHENLIPQLCLGWTVKAFFLPLMFGYLVNSLNSMGQGTDWTQASFMVIFNYLHDFAYLIDLLVVTVGYLCTLRIIDTHIRTSEPTFLGWVVAIICYHPFWGLLFYNEYFAYKGTSWHQAFSAYPVLQAFWAYGILLLTYIYAWASVCFGLRFSNLTYRGLISSGCYRWTRHPAYLTKNLSWWMISLPFMIEGSAMEVLRNCLLLLGINLIYYIRAKTEERHLLRYPEYQEYYLWMQEHGVITRPLYLLERLALRQIRPLQRGIEKIMDL